MTKTEHIESKITLIRRIACDICNVYAESEVSLTEMSSELQQSGWQVKNNKVYCPECFGRLN